MNIERYNPNIEGGQIGIISGEPGDVYHANPAISNSDLKLFLSDPKRFEAIRKGEIEPKSSDDLLFGDVFHTRTLESNEVFQSRFVLDSIAPPKPTKAQLEAHANFIAEFKPSAEIKGDLLSSNGKKPTSTQIKAQEKRSKLIQEYDNFWMAHDGKTLVKNYDSNRAFAMRESLFADPDAKKLLNGFEDMHKELTFRTKELKSDELEYGFSVQAKFDIFDENKGVAIDLKKISSLDNCRSNAKKFGYYRQAAFYMMVFEAMVGNPLERFFFAFVEDTAPYEVAIFEVKKDSQEYQSAFNQIGSGLRALADSLRSGVFPKRYPGINEFGFGDWDLRQDEQRIERLESGVAA